jgi:hypothetical protein
MGGNGGRSQLDIRVLDVVIEYAFTQIQFDYSLLDARRGLPRRYVNATFYFFGGQLITIIRSGILNPPLNFDFLSILCSDVNPYYGCKTRRILVNIRSKAMSY